MRGSQGHFGVTQLALSAMSGFVALYAQKVDLMYQRPADAVFEHGIFDQIKEAGLRHPWQQLFFVDGFGQLFCKATQARKAASGVDMEYSFSQARQIRKDIVAGAQKFEVH